MTPLEQKLERELGRLLGLAAAALEGAVLGCGEASANVSVTCEFVRIEVFALGHAGRVNIWTLDVDLQSAGEVSS